jgi:Ca2+-binding RTX toxin-like protein
MGRALLTGESIGSSAHAYYPLDLFHYSSAGVHDFVGTRPGYFSVNNGVTNLDNFNTNSGGDFGDWAASAGHDSFLAFSPSGVADVITPTDLSVMDVIGWDRASSSGASPPPASAPSLTLSNLSFDSADATLSFVLHNEGTAAAPASMTGIYLSADTTIATSDKLIATSPAPALAPGGSDTESVALSLPTNLAAHVYYLGAISDFDGAAGGGSHVSSGVAGIVLGNNSANNLTGISAAHVMFGLGGNDTLNDGPGGDTMYGGIGNDTYNVRSAADTVVENSGQGTDTVRTSLSYALPDNVENLVLTGSGATTAIGNGSNNTITGNSGANVLDGGLGLDRLTGGGGADTFVFNTALDAVTNVDTITDFRHAQADKIALDHTIFTALSAPQIDGSLLPSDFYASTNGAAHAATDFLLYNTKTGVLSYDPDGNGSAEAIHIATLSNHAALTAHDFLIV